MPEIEKVTGRNGKTKYKVDVRVHGRRLRPTFETAKLAQEFLNTAIRANQARRLGLIDITPKEESVSIKEFIEKYDAKVVEEKFNAVVRKNDKKTLSELYDFLVGEEELEFVNEVKLEHLEDFQKLLGKRMKAASVNRKFNTIKHLFNKGKDWGLPMGKRFPLDGLQPLRARPAARIPWNGLHYRAVMKSAEPYYRDYLRGLRLSGLRPIEACTLTWPKVNFKARSATVHSWKNSSGGDREVPLSDRLYRLLWRLREEQLASGTYRKDGHVFLRDDGKVLTQDNAEKVFAKIRTEWAFPMELSLYGLRHYFCTRLVKKNISTFQVRDLMGHAQIKTTEIYAGRVNTEHLRQLLNGN